MSFWPFSGHISLNRAFLHFHEKFNALKAKHDRWLKFGRDVFFILSVCSEDRSKAPSLGDFSNKNVNSPKTKENIHKSILTFVEHPKEIISAKFQPSIMFSLERITFFVKV